MNALSVADIKGAPLATLHAALPELRRMRIEAAAELWRKDWTINAIAAEIQVPATAIRGWINKNRDLFPFRRGAQAVVPPVPDSPELFEAARLWAEGHCLSVIGRRLGVSAALVSRWTRGRPELFPPRDRMPQPAGPRPPQRLTPPAPPRAIYLDGLDTLQADVPQAGPRRLTMLKAGCCKWPVSGEGAGTLFCARPIDGGSYCGRHRKKAFAPRKCERV